ncbi:hypothetical protein PR048_004480 [Dryococelus australis]|uniref:Uncharacterized protein n=1 Tax=Dryococelus australis TaxID=614101 RepID=A0ABQ9I6C6_9NEOP|nr:hypothetical protein PR048_004480 [Dryococelus australis]
MAAGDRQPPGRRAPCFLNNSVNDCGDSKAKPLRASLPQPEAGTVLLIVSRHLAENTCVGVRQIAAERVSIATNGEPSKATHDRYETANGIKANEKGTLKQTSDPENPQVIVAEGAYSYTAPEGIPISIQYVATDDGGFVATGDAIPTPPPIPPAIQRALDFIAANPPRADGPGKGRRPQSWRKQSERQPRLPATSIGARTEGGAWQVATTTPFATAPSVAAPRGAASALFTLGLSLQRTDGRC